MSCSVKPFPVLNSRFHRSHHRRLLFVQLCPQDEHYSKARVLSRVLCCCCCCCCCRKTGDEMVVTIVIISLVSRQLFCNVAHCLLCETIIQLYLGSRCCRCCCWKWQVQSWSRNVICNRDESEDALNHRSLLFGKKMKKKKLTPLKM